MIDGRLQAFVRRLRVFADRTVAGGLVDSDLLERFLSERDQAAFEVLIWRHGDLVWNLCRRMLRNEHDAEDAFQATFLTFVRKAHSISKRESVGSWLHKVAYRVVLEVRSRQAKQRVCERPALDLVPASPTLDPDAHELRPVLDEEIARLPFKCRVPFVLCYLEGKTNAEAARQLGCPEGTVVSRLASARRRLRDRLTRRGVTVSAGTVAAVLSASLSDAAAAPRALLESTVRFGLQSASAKAGAIATGSGQAAALAQGVLKAMAMTKLRQIAAGVLLVSLIGTGAGVSIHQVLAQKPALEEKQQTPGPVSGDTTKTKEDRRELQGTWESSEMVTESRNGQPLVPRQRKVTWVITPEEVLWVGEDGFIDESWAVRFGPTKKPRNIDLTSQRLGTLRGIYLLEGDTLKIHFGPMDKPPSSFPSKGEGVRTFKRTSQTPAAVTQRFPSPTGCFWMVEPTNPPLAFATLGITFFYEKDRDGAATITLAYPVPDEKLTSVREYRPVLLDAERNRHLPDPVQSAGSAARNGGPMVMLARWRMDPTKLPANKVARVGIEAVTTEARRIAAREALDKARNERIEVLPWPTLGETYPFVLTATDGHKIRSADLKGKVVLLDCWASWCSPCMTLSIELKPLYEKWHAAGLEIIGVSFDKTAEAAEKACKQNGFTWPQVLVPTDAKTRELWGTATGIDALPRLLLIDSNGILHSDSPQKLDEEIARLLRDSPRHP